MIGKKPYSYFFKQINKTDNTLVKLTKEKERFKITNERGGITTDSVEIQMIIKNYYQPVHMSKLNNLEEKDKFLYNLPEIHN